MTVESAMVSIGLSTFNRAGDYLPVALESALAQTYQNLEIVVSDNASTDDTEALVRAYDDRRIHYFKQPKNIGANPNFNFCLDQAKGRYFLLLHDDDRIDPDFVQTCMDAVGQAEVGIVRTGTRVIDGSGATVVERTNDARGLSTADFFLAWFTGATALYLCSTLFHTRWLKELGGFHSKHDLLQDALAQAELAARHGRVDVPDVKASFRRHGSNRGSTERIVDWCEDSEYLLDRMCDLIPDRAKRKQVHEQGLAFMAKQNYNRLTRLDATDLRMYWYIYRTFGYRYSPLRYWIWRAVTSPTMKMLRSTKRAVEAATTNS